MVVFMLGLAAGRILSLVLDGLPNALLLIYLVLELALGIIGLMLINKSTNENFGEDKTKI